MRTRTPARCLKTLLLAIRFVYCLYLITRVAHFLRLRSRQERRPSEHSRWTALGLLQMGVMQFIRPRSPVVGRPQYLQAIQYAQPTYEGVFPFEIANDSGLDTGTNPVYYEDGTYCTSCTIASITTATANDLVLYVVMQDYATTYSALTPYTLSGQYSLVTGNENSWLTSNYTEVSAGTVTGSFTSSSGYQFFSMVVAVK